MPAWQTFCLPDAIFFIPAGCPGCVQPLSVNFGSHRNRLQASQLDKHRHADFRARMANAAMRRKGHYRDPFDEPR